MNRILKNLLIISLREYYYHWQMSTTTESLEQDIMTIQRVNIKMLPTQILNKYDLFLYTQIYRDLAIIARWQMTETQQDLNIAADGPEAEFNCFKITFSNQEFTCDLEFRLSSNNQSLEIIVIDQAILHQYHANTFTMQTLPKEFIPIFDSLTELFQYIVESYETSLEIRFEGQHKELATVNIKVQIIKKKIRQLQLTLQVRPATETMKQSANLAKLEKETEAQNKVLEEALTKEKQFEMELSFVQGNVDRLKKENEKELEEYATQIQNEESQEEKNRALENQINAKKKEIKQTIKLLKQSGYLFTQDQAKMFEQFFKISSGTINLKNMKHEKPLKNDIKPIFQSQKSSASNQKEASKQPKEKQIKDVICAKPQNVSKNPQTPCQQMKSIEKNISNQEPKIEIISSKNTNRQLLISDSESKENNDIQWMYPPIKEESEMKIMQKKVDSPQINKQQTKQPSKSRKKIDNENNCITILSSQQDDADDKWNDIGKKIDLDFSKSEYANKYSFEIIKNRLCIERIFDDKSYYHLYHKESIKEKQHMQFNIYSLVRKDLNFGIIGKQAIKVSRQEWPKEVICWVGCLNQIINQLDITKMHDSMSSSDQITVAVNPSSKTISFFLNKKIVFQGHVPDQIINECYFFVETASKGTKITYIINTS